MSESVTLLATLCLADSYSWTDFSEGAARIGATAATLQGSGVGLVALVAGASSGRSAGDLVHDAGVAGNARRAPVAGGGPSVATQRFTHLAHVGAGPGGSPSRAGVPGAAMQRERVFGHARQPGGRAA